MVFEERRGRDRLSILAEILDIAGDGTLKTQIMYRANLSFAQLNEYLKLMLKIRLLEKFGRNGKDMYRATEKGADFLQRHNEIKKILRFESDEHSAREEKQLIRVMAKKRPEG